MAKQATLHVIKKGLKLPLLGEPEQIIEEGPTLERVALLADDYIGMRPRMKVQEGETVKRGQVVFEDRKVPGVFHTSPGSGKVVAINRGDRRALESVVIELDEAEKNGGDVPEVDYKNYSPKNIDEWTAEEIRSLLIETGTWTVLRTRPFGRVPHPESSPGGIFITAHDTHPLAINPGTVLENHPEEYEAGIRALAKLAGDKKVYHCIAAGSKIPTPDLPNVEVHEFKGPHPSGTPGLHMHRIKPAHSGNTVWHLYYQEVASIGRLLNTGKVSVRRYVALAGPMVKRPRIIKTRRGADLSALTRGEIDGENYRIITGSVFSGRTAMGDVFGYLGRFNTQISVIPEVTERRFLGWMAPGAQAFTKTRLFLSRLLPKPKFKFNTDTNGSVRALVPIGLYEKVMPFDLMVPFLLRSLLAGDLERSEELGCLELDEEDVSLCSFVCPSKIDYGAALRDILTRIEKEG